MKLQLLLILIFFSGLLNQLQAQSAIFKIGKSGEILPGDTIKTWHNCTGSVVDSSCATYYVIGKLDPEHNSVIGEIKAYNMAKKLLFKAIMNNGRLNGKAIYFYTNGKIKESGIYDSDRRVGIWRYFYENGSANKILNFNGNIPNVIAQYAKNGKATVIDGNGRYESEWSSNGCQLTFSASGNVKNGVLDGKWTMYNIVFKKTMSDEYFDNGKFIKGVEAGNTIGSQVISNYNFNYTDNSKISLTGYNTFENINLNEFGYVCGEYYKFSETYNKVRYTDFFYPKLIEEIRKQNDLKNQWVIVTIDFDKAHKIKNVSTFSSLHDEKLQTWVSSYIKNLPEPWKNEKENAKQDVTMCFPIIINNAAADERVLIPEEFSIRQMRTKD